MRELLAQIRIAALLAAAVLLPAATASAQSGGRPRSSLAALQKSRADLWTEYSGHLQRLVDYCESKQLSEGAEEVRRYLVPPDPTTIRAASLPTRIEADPADAASEDERYWRTQLRYRRREYGKQLYLLSRRALHSGHPGFAYDLVREIAHHDSDHQKARELLGYTQFGDEWITPFAKKMLQKGYVWHDQFGWLPKAHVSRYESGERNVDGRWMSQDKEEEIRRDFAYAWEIRTDHYLIRTNFSLERGVELGRALEDFYVFFHQTFAGFFNEPEQLQKLFDGSSPAARTNSRPYTVHYYRSRDEYVERLEKVFPSIKVTNGIYLTRDRTAHFYHDPAGDNAATLFHEATHQLFFESHLQDRPIGESAHFWIIEGIACYMESFRRDRGEFSVGDPRYIRFAGARMNYLDQKYYVPLQEFSSLGMREFQSAPMLAKNYTQASGLAHFFMQYEGGRYRDALVAHLAQLYSGNARKREHAQNLAELTHVEFDELDRQYGEFLRACQTQLAAAGSDAATERPASAP